jgi:hypothetical protein
VSPEPPPTPDPDARPDDPADPRAAVPAGGDPHAGAGLVLLDFAATGALAVAGAAGILAPDSAGAFTAVIAGVLFTVGVGLFLWGFAIGVVRSRDEQVTLAGLFFLSGTAPKVVRFRLRLAFAVQVALAVAAASIRPYTEVAFAVLAPMLGLGAMSAWGARHGTFFPRDDLPRQDLPPPAGSIR